MVEDRKQRIERMRREHVERSDPLPAILAGREMPPSGTLPNGRVRVREIEIDLLYAPAKAALNGEARSVSWLQRELHIGHDRAKQLIEDVTIGRHIVEVKVKGLGWASAGVVLSTGWYRVAEAIEKTGTTNTRKLWRAIQRSLGLKWFAPWEMKT